MRQEQAAETLDQLLEVALAPKTDPTTRRGAAMGVGATVKGGRFGRGGCREGMFGRVKAIACLSFVCLLAFLCVLFFLGWGGGREDAFPRL